MTQSSGACAGKGMACPAAEGGGDRQEEGGTYASQ